MTLFVRQSGAPKVIFEYFPEWSDARVVVIDDSLGIVENKVSVVTVYETKRQNDDDPAGKQRRSG